MIAIKGTCISFAPLLSRSRRSPRNPFGLPFLQSNNLFELPPHFHDDLTRRPAHRLHGHGAESERQHPAEQQADDNLRIQQRQV
jgi:hypothetical protein